MKNAGWILALAIGGLLVGCKVSDTKPDEPEPALLSGHTCCNFHYEGDWINDGNYAQLPMIPAGSPIRVKSYGRYRAHVDIDGKPFRLGLDYGRNSETTEKWVAKLVTQADPRVRLASYPPNVREAILAGKIMLGMSKEQVIMSLGYPITDENPRLDAPFWKYWWSSFGRYDVYWSGDHVSKVDAHPETLMHVLAPGHATAAPAPAKQDAKSRARSGSEKPSSAK
ncbi:MAG: hypothetical protein HZT41_12605 [Dechloromonas sp.]|nr:MAG: hypothetical protein HZT41_12605 [Dechloromonas sp.]